MRIWIAIGVFIGVTLLIFLAFTLRISESTAPVSKEVPEAAVSDVQYTDTYSKGVHTIKGSGTVATACTELNATSTVTESGAIRVDLSAAIDEGLCLRVPTKKTFTLKESAGEDAHIEVYANGAAIPD